MPKLCDCDPPNYVPGEPFVRGRDCARCWLYANDAGHQATADGIKMAPAASPAEPLTEEEKAKVRGFGDDVEAVAKFLGADRLARLYESVTGRPCGCQGRKELLNNLPSLRDALRKLMS